LVRELHAVVPALRVHHDLNMRLRSEKAPKIVHPGVRYAE
jgi:hypothetical protein